MIAERIRAVAHGLLAVCVAVPTTLAPAALPPTAELLEAAATGAALGGEQTGTRTARVVEVEPAL